MFLGTDEFSIEVLKPLLDAEDLRQHVQVMTAGPTFGKGPRGPQTETWRPPLYNFAQKYCGGSLVYQPKIWNTSPPEITEPDISGQPSRVLVNSQNDFLVVASFGKIIPSHVLDRYNPSRRLNVHPSLLPKLRGASPIQMAIYDRHKETGVSIIGLEKKVDSGNIWAQDKFGLYDDETFFGLRAKLSVLGGRMLVDVLRNILAGEANSRPQGEGETYTQKITDELANINWKETTARQLAAMWRAIGYVHPPKTNFRGRGGHKRIVRFIEVTECATRHPRLKVSGECIYVKETGLLHVRCANDTEATIAFAHTEGSSMTSAKEWRNGMPKQITQFGVFDEGYRPHQGIIF